MSKEENPNDIPSPDEDKSARKIVKIQIEAMAENNEPYEDAGIETAFNFASPENKASTGPIDRFKKMVKNPRYRQMLNSNSYRIQETDIGEKQGLIRAELENEDSIVTYEFNVGIQESGEYEGCWMTDSVLRID